MNSASGWRATAMSAPGTTIAGPWSPPMASSAMRRRLDMADGNGLGALGRCRIPAKAGAVRTIARHAPDTRRAAAQQWRLLLALAALQLAERRERRCARVFRFGRWDKYGPGLARIGIDRQREEFRHHGGQIERAVHQRIGRVLVAELDNQAGSS